MAGKIVIAACDWILAAHLAAHCLASSHEGDVLLLAGGAEDPAIKDSAIISLHKYILLSAKNLGAEFSRSECLQVVVWDVTQFDLNMAAGGLIEEVWFLTQGLNAAACQRIGQSLQEIGVRKFNCVSLQEQPELESLCRSRNVEWRRFRVALAVDENWPELPGGTNGLLQFLDAIHGVRREIEERLSEYFDFQSLRCWSPKEAWVNLVSAQHAVELMILLARQETTRGQTWDIAGPQDTMFAELCEQVGLVYELNLLPEEDRQQLNAVDLLLERRLQSFIPYLTEAGAWNWQKSYAAVNFNESAVVFNEAAQVKLFKAIRNQQDKAWKQREQQVAQFSAEELERKTLARGGAELAYFTAGQGPAVVILNALGQGQAFWYRLIERLKKRYKIVIWDQRGVGVPPHPFNYHDQVDDLDAILRTEGIESCHLVGWCTGPKIAIEFYLQRPKAVTSMVFLNSAFSSLDDEHPFRELDTVYTRNLNSLCRSLDKRPVLASSMMKYLQESAVDDKKALLDEMDNHQFAKNVLSLTPACLKSAVVVPFQNEASTLHYARQIVDLLTCDANPNFPQIEVPVLLVATEFDRIAGSAASHAVAQLLPRAWCVQVAGASHYCLYDRPDLICGLMDGFFLNPADNHFMNSQPAEIDCVNLAEPVPAQ